MITLYPLRAKTFSSPSASWSQFFRCKTPLNKSAIHAGFFFFRVIKKCRSHLENWWDVSPCVKIYCDRRKRGFESQQGMEWSTFVLLRCCCLSICLVPMKFWWNLMGIVFFDISLSLVVFEWWVLLFLSLFVVLTSIDVWFSAYSKISFQ